MPKALTKAIVGGLVRRAIDVGEHVDANLEGSGQPEAASRANWRFSRLTCTR